MHPAAAAALRDAEITLETVLDIDPSKLRAMVRTTFETRTSTPTDFAPTATQSVISIMLDEVSHLAPPPVVEAPKEEVTYRNAPIRIVVP